MFKINKRCLIDIGRAFADIYLEENKNEKRYVTNNRGTIGVNKEADITVYFWKDKSIGFFENDNRIADVYLEKMKVENYDNKKWKVTLYNRDDGIVEVRLHNKEKDSFMCWEIEKDDNDYTILEEYDNDEVFDNPELQFNFKKGLYYDFEKDKCFKIENLFKENK